MQKDASASVHNTSGQTELEKLKPGRLTKRPEFLCVAKDGQKWVSDHVIVQALNTDTDKPRFGFTATKKIGNAVTRNRAKRRLRAAVDQIVKDHDIQSADIVLIARDTTAICEWDDLIKNLTWCLKRLKVIT